MATRNKRAKITLSTEDMTVTYQPYLAGTATLDGRSVVISPTSYPVAIQNLLMLDRLRNKAMDAYSDASEDVIAAVTAVDEMLRAGNWRSAGGERAEQVTLFVEAYARFHKLEVPAVQATINTIEAGDDDTKKGKLAAWRKHAVIRQIMADIQLEKAREKAKAAKEAAKGTAVPALETL